MNNNLYEETVPSEKMSILKLLEDEDIPLSASLCVPSMGTY